MRNIYYLPFCTVNSSILDMIYNRSEQVVLLYTKFIRKVCVSIFISQEKEGQRTRSSGHLAKDF